VKVVDRTDLDDRAAAELALTLIDR
jgi:hypothetical protein